MPIDIRDGKRVEYVKLGISIPEELSRSLEKYREIEGTRARMDRSAVISSAVEFYLAAKGALPADYELTTEAEVVRDLMAAHRKGAKKKK